MPQIVALCGVSLWEIDGGLPLGLSGVSLYFVAGVIAGDVIDAAGTGIGVALSLTKLF